MRSKRTQPPSSSALGLVAMDAVHLVGFTVVLTCGLAVGWMIAGLAWWMPVRIAVALMATILTCAFFCMAIGALLPRPKPGRYKLMSHPAFYAWVLHFVVRRWLDVPPLSTLVSQSNLLRTLALRAFGAEVAWSANMSSDVYVFDPALFSMGAGAMCGSGTMICGHFVTGPVLYLAPVALGARVQLAAKIVVAPGVSIGDDTRLGFGCQVGTDVKIGKHCKIGPSVVISSHCRLGNRVRVHEHSYLPPGTELQDDAVWPPPK